MLSLRSVLVAASAFALAVISGCDPDGGADVSSAIRGNRGAGGARGLVDRDSIGIRIVENLSDAAPEWTIDTVPTVRIGVVEGAPEYTLHNVGGALRLSDGRIVIVNAGRELRFYDAEGQHLYDSGKSGSAPGEYESIAGLVLVQDSLFIFDERAQRLSFVDVSGEFLGSTPLLNIQRLIGARPRLVAASRDRLVFLGAGWPIPRRDSVGLFWVGVPNVVVARGGEHVDSLGAAGMEWLTGQQQVLVPPFTRVAYAAADPRHVVVTNPNRYEIEVWTTDGGRLERLIRLARNPAPLSRAEFDSAAQGLVDRELRAQFGNQPRPGARDRLERLVSELQRYSSKPTYSGVLFDTDGNIWARRWAPSGATVHAYDVFEPTGRLAAQVRIPAGWSLLQVDRDLMLVRQRDSLNVEYVAAYRVLRTG